MAKKKAKLSNKEFNSIALAVLIAFYFLREKAFAYPGISSVILGVILALIPLSILLMLRNRRFKRARILDKNCFFNDYSPKEFEDAAAELFRRFGFQSEVTPYVGDQGLDVVIEKAGQRIGVQCKCYGPGNKIALAQSGNLRVL